MLTDLSFLERGKQWPPPCQRERLATYEAHRKLFECEHADVYKRQLRRIVRVIGNFDEVISFSTIFTYQRLMSLKMADLVFGEPPSITVPDTTRRGAVNTEKQQVIDKILIDTELINQGYAAAVDTSRYGDGVLQLGHTQQAVTVDAITPALWFPVVNRTNHKRTLYDVLAYAYAVDEKRGGFQLYAEIHKPDEPGSCEVHTYALEGPEGDWRIGKEVKPDEKQDAKTDTGLPCCPVFRIPNVLTSDRVFGLDDYEPIDSIISELIVRVSQVSRVLDRHASPSMSGPASALARDPDTGQWGLRLAGYFAREDGDDPAPEYITWDGSLDAAFKQIELLTNQLYMISEMGAAIFGDLSNKTGSVPSGSALRRLMISPLAKAARITARFDPVLKRLLSACASLYGADIKPEEITIRWNDGLPEDEAEQAQIMSTRTGGQPTISQYTAIQRLDHMSAEDVDSELEQMREESAGRTPPVMSAFSPRGDDTPDKDPALEDSG